MILLSLGSFATIHSSFSCSATKGCSPLVITLTDHSTGNITNRQWSFGNGNGSTLAGPSATYLTPGTYSVKLIVSNGTEADTSSQTVTVFSAPVVDFVSDRTAACPFDSLQFTNHVTAGSAPVNQFAWGFGNGIASNASNASYRYPASGTYDVTLVVQDTNGCNGHLTKPAYITVWPKPTASFTASPLISCGPTGLVNFTDQSVGTGLTYSWNFGDSTGAGTANPSHLYNYGKRYAHLIVANNFGCIDSFKKEIDVIYVKADFAAFKTTVCAGEQVNFADQSPMSGHAWHWDFGDGTGSNLQNPHKVYSHPGIYSVTFIVSDAICSDSNTRVGYITVTPGFSVGFTADNQNSCTTPFSVNFTGHAPAGTSLTWNFGNGTTSNLPNPSSTYNNAAAYTVTLTAVDSNGCSVSASVPGFINTTMPIIRYSADTLVCPGTLVAFYNQSQNAVRFLWNFGDGDTSTAKSPRHRYTHFGHYTVTVTAWDSIGCDSTVVRPSYIFVDTTAVDFSVDERFSMCPPLVSVFRNLSNRSDLTYHWDFGDGYTDTAANPTHIYFRPGVYSVKLIGTNRYGCTSNIVYNNLITVQGPSGTFTMNPNTGCIPVDVTFSAHPSANTQTVICDLGDGNLYTDSLNFNYVYNTANIFHPKFILTDQVGCTVSYALDSIIAYSSPVLNLKDTSICAGQTVKIDMANGQYHWRSRGVLMCDTCYIALGPCDTCRVQNLQPEDTTVYEVTATNAGGCSARATFQINVVPLPVLIAQDTITMCKDASTTIHAVQQAETVRWIPATGMSNSNAFSPVCTPQHSQDYVVMAYNSIGCSVSEVVAVRTVDYIPLTVSGDTSVCAGSPVQLAAFVNDTFFHEVSYTWTQAPLLSNPNISDPMATVYNTERFQVTASSGSCPSSVAYVTVTVNPYASIQLPATTTTTQYTELSITPVSTDLTSYSWSAKDQLSCTECATTTLTPKESQVVYLEGKNQYGCATKDSMLVQVLSCDPASIFVPNTFTPNADGTNDKLYVRSKTLSQLEYFRLFNRWGAVVYETKNVADGWDGNINGKMAEQGVYVYQISGKCESGYDLATSGTVTLIR